MRGERHTAIPFAVAVLLAVAVLAGCASAGEPAGNPERMSTIIPGPQVGGGGGSVDPGDPRGAPVPVSPTCIGVPTPSCPATPPRPDNTIDATHVTTGMHIEQHEEFVRVIYDFGGPFTPGWRAEYVAEATPRGQPTSTPIDGRSILQVYFFDTVGASGEAGYSGPNPLTAPATGTVTEVHLSPSYRGTTQSFIGIHADHPEFRVTRLTNPARIAVDIYGN